MASLCEAMYRDGLTKEDLFDNLGHIISGGIDTDILSGWGAIVYVMTPTGIEARYLKTKMI